MSKVNLDELEIKLIHIMTSQKHIMSFIEQDKKEIAYGVAEKQVKALEEILEDFKVENK